jgi:hypothetical protein
VHSKNFKNEILSFGKVNLYKKEKLYEIIDCKNKKIVNPPKFNCLLLEGKNFILLNNIILYMLYRLLEYHKTF